MEGTGQVSRLSEGVWDTSNTAKMSMHMSQGMYGDSPETGITPMFSGRLVRPLYS